MKFIRYFFQQIYIFPFKNVFHLKIRIIRELMIIDYKSACFNYQILFIFPHRILCFFLSLPTFFSPILFLVLNFFYIGVFYLLFFVTCLMSCETFLSLTNCPVNKDGASTYVFRFYMHCLHRLILHNFCRSFIHLC